MADFEDVNGSNSSNNETFQEVLDARLSRRGFLGSGAAAAAGLSLSGTLLKAVPVSAHGRRPRKPLLGFKGIPVSTADTVVVPPGYTAEVLIAWGDPVGKGPEFEQDASNSADDQAKQWGMHNDGVVYFPIDGSSRHGLLAQNNEYADEGLLFTDGIANWDEEKTNKSLNAHGVSIIEITRDIHEGHHHHRPRWRNRGSKEESDWRIVKNSKYARRITGQTPMRIGGPAAGDDRLKTIDDPAGRRVLGTLNNCAMGFTPWGTYLTCEENFNGYFFRTTSPDSRSNLEKRYGISPSNSGLRWHTTHPRFNADLYPNEANRFGWVVEIDPFAPHSTPVKRTALGRLKHEGAWVQETRSGRIVVYMGDDERNEYIYRYVSRLPWRIARRLGISPLNDGTLYVAKFKSDGTGEWLPLTPDNPALVTWTLNDILINTRGAADAVGATMMDRPEWIDTFPESLTAIATLTNNNRRGSATPPTSNNPDGSTVAGSARPGVDASNPRANNVYGHIITWSYSRDFDQPGFTWDVFALCGDPEVPAHGSTIDGDKFGSPDGIYVAPSGRLWIQTDVSTSTINSGDYAGFGHNQMLCSDPTTGEIRRFLVGPRQCEITGVFATPDEKTLFVGIQHPGETPDLPSSSDSRNDPADPKKYSSWPDGDEGGRPRSACIVITKDDGGEIGS